MTTETKRDLHADLAICEAASAGPWLFEPGSDPEWDGGFAGGIIAHSGDYVCDFGDSTQYYPSEGSPPSTEDATFITEARTGWPHAIERAINAETRIRELCESNAYYIDQFNRIDDRRWELEEAVSRMGNEVADAEEENARLRAGIAVAMTYSGGIIVEMLRKLLTEVPADE
jgi:hypothetical protein